MVNQRLIISRDVTFLENQKYKSESETVEIIVGRGEQTGSQTTPIPVVANNSGSPSNISSVPVTPVASDDSDSDSDSDDEKKQHLQTQIPSSQNSSASDDGG